jgi:hypothetical protein
LFDALALASVTTGAILLSQYLFTDLGSLLSPYVSSLPATPLIAAALHPFPVGYVRAGSALFSQGGGAPFELHLTLSQVCPPPLLNLLAGLFGYTAVHRDRTTRTILTTSVVVAVYCAIRIVILAAMFIDTRDLGPFVDPSFVFATTAPAALLLLLLVPLRPAVDHGPARSSSSLWSASTNVVPAALTVFLVGVWALQRFDGPVLRKNGRVLIDEHHSNWAWTDRRYSPTDFGILTEYHYGWLFDRLSDIYHVRRNYAPLDSAGLSDVDVLLLKTPSRPFDPLEIQAIDTFVRRGGGLLLIGDHTDVFGSSSIMNELVAKTGVMFANVSVFDLRDQGHNVWVRHGLFWSGLLDRVRRIGFATSCAVELNGRARNVMAVSDAYADRGNYGREGFFGGLNLSPDDRAGTLSVVATASSGRGRIVWFTDSTIFSNFALYNPDNLELCLSLVSWLNCRPIWIPVRWAGTGMVLLALVVVVWAGVAGQIDLGHLLSGGAMAVLIGSGLGAILKARAEEPLRWKDQQLYFDSDHCRFALDERYDFLLLSSAKNVVTQQTFYTISGRTGIIPRVAPGCPPSNAASCLVMFDPVREVTRREAKEIGGWVKGGGTLLVLDSARNRHSAANALLEPYGLRMIDADDSERTAVRVGRKDCVLFGWRQVEGGERVLADLSGRTVLGMRRVGNGKVVAMGCSSVFADSSLGFLGRTPESDQMTRIGLAYLVFASCKGDRRPSDGKALKQ